MKLSTAIRLGAMLRPQVRFNLFSDGGSCAMGAALEASGFGCDRYFMAYKDNRDSLRAMYPILDYDPPNISGLPEITQGCRNVWEAVVWLNNYGEWTRERIADWVATIEAQQEQRAAAPDAVPMEVA